MATRKRLDPHQLAARILPKFEELNLEFFRGRWTRRSDFWQGVYPKRELEAIVSRCLRVELDAAGDDRPVTSSMVREVILALASYFSWEASKIVETK